MRLVVEPARVEMQLRLTFQVMRVVIQHERHAMDHDERVVIHELQTDSRETEQEILSPNLLHGRAVEGVAFFPLFQFGVQLLHRLGDFLGGLLQAASRVELVVNAAFDHR